MKQKSITSFFSPPPAKKAALELKGKGDDSSSASLPLRDCFSSPTTGARSKSSSSSGNIFKSPLAATNNVRETIGKSKSNAVSHPVDDDNDVLMIDDDDNPFVSKKECEKENVIEENKENAKEKVNVKEKKKTSSSTPITVSKRRVIIESSSSSESEEEADDEPVAKTPLKSTPKSVPIIQSTPKSVPIIQSTPVSQKLSHFILSPRGVSSPQTQPASSPSTTTTPNRKSSVSNTGRTPSKTPTTSSKNMDEERYSWLVKVKDANGLDLDHPDYDPRTLYIPPSAWKKFTPFEKQFWEIKSQHFDTVVFFKKGKFYELYEQDADVGTREFDLKMTDRVNMRMVGVPEASFSFWAAKFVAKGYKVARVDQMETAIGKSIREKSEKPTKDDKIIRRELTCILTAGTLIDSKMLSSDLSTYCLSFKEFIDPTDPTRIDFGVSFVDTATAQFYLSYIQDDSYRTKFETLLVQIQPREVVYSKKSASQDTLKWMKNVLPYNTIWNSLVPGKEFWEQEKTLEQLERRSYFDTGFPDCLEHFKENALVISSFGGLVHYLTNLKLDVQLLSLGNISQYDPVKHGKTLILDGATLQNLEVFKSSSGDDDSSSTLFGLLDHCVTPFGRRLFKRWLCYPLRSIPEIEERLDAVDELATYRDDLVKLLSKYPDLERMLSRIHAGSSKLNDFLTVINAFKYTKESLFKDFLSLPTTGNLMFKSPLLRRMVETSIDFDAFSEALEPFLTGFDHAIAKKEGNIIPKVGMEPEYDEASDRVKEIEASLAAHLKEQSKALKTNDIRYKDVGKELFQLELPASLKVPDNFICMSQTKAYKRYWNETIRGLVKQYQEALEIKTGILKTILQRIMAKFDAHYRSVWIKIVDFLAQLDALLCLVTCRFSIGEPCCRPVWVAPKDENQGATVKFKDLRHPCVQNLSNFIANDIELGEKGGKRIVLLTGPNMGGKSTLLRQTCIGIILAQLGCYVPASACELSPIDRIFTRIGAHDNIMAGQSTFMLELTETSKILWESTRNSLVILDELGRGTSTFDGYAIAYSVLHYLANWVGCVGLFATHYLPLTRDFANHPAISLKHMKCVVDEIEKRVTFLYRLVPGICPKSYGMNVAAMAGLPPSLVEEATKAALLFESQQREKKQPNANDEIEVDEEQEQGSCDKMSLVHDLRAVKRWLNGEPGINDEVIMTNLLESLRLSSN